jgi:hypothetical protein
LLQIKQKFKNHIFLKKQKVERAPIPRNDMSYLGNVYVSQTHPFTANTHNFSNNLVNATNLLVKTSIQFPSPLDMDYTNSKTNQISFNNWKSKSTREPNLEVLIDKPPLYLCSYRQYLFSVDDKERLLVFNATSSNNIEFILCYDIPLPEKSVRSIGVNSSFFALTYSIAVDKDKKFLKDKKLKPNGVLLYPRDQHVINFKEPKFIQLNTGEEFVAPIGISMNENYAFICDRGLKALFKFDIRRSDCLRRINIDGEPYKLSINKNYLILSDTLNHHLNLYDTENLGLIKYVFLEQADGKNGPFTVHLSSDNVVFYKNQIAAQLSFLDINLEDNNIFSKIKDQIQGFTVMECATNQILVTGCIGKKGYKLVCYFNS